MKIKSIERLRFLLYFTNVCYAVGATIPTILIGKLLDEAIKESSYDTFIKYTIIIVSIIIITICFGLLKNWIKSIEIKRARKELETLVFHSTMKTEDTVETIINAFDTEINLIINNYVKHDGDYILIFVPFAIALVYSVVITYKTMLTIVICFILVFLINQILLIPFSKHMRVLSKENENINYIVSRYLKAIVSIKLYGGLRFASDTILEALQNRNKKESEKKGYLLIIEGINCVFSTLLQLIPLAVLAYMVIESKVTVGVALSIMLLLEKIVSPIDQVGELKEDKASASDALKHIKSIINENNKVLKSPSHFLKEEIVGIEICNLTVKVGEKVIVDRFNYSFSRGKKYLIVGKNGVGKSTILKVLSKQIKDYSGMIYINGVELREIDEKNLFKLMGVLPQFPEIFIDSIEHNIAVNETYDEKKVYECIEQLEMTNLINSKEDSILNLSGGEKQRINIARMLYHPKPLYLLDEVLCGLDVEQTRKLEKLILDLENTTIIHISHRTPKDIMDLYDQVVLVSNDK